jgi:hypothetical protein
MRTRIMTGSAGFAIAAVFAIGGCSSHGSAPNVAGGGATPSGAPKDQRAIQQAWVDCMHAQGQTGVNVTKDGVIVQAAGAAPGSSAPAPVGDYATAAKTCDAKVPGYEQLAQNSSSDRVKRLLASNRVYVDCARKHGYPDLADADPATGILHVDPKTFNQAKWDQAVAACSKDAVPAYVLDPQ